MDGLYNFKYMFCRKCFILKFYKKATAEFRLVVFWVCKFDAVH